MDAIPSLPPDPMLYHGFDEDFDHLVTGDRWTTVLTDTGSVTVVDGVGGQAVCGPSDATVADNDEAYCKTLELFLIASGKPIIAQVIAKFAQTDTDKANHAFGLMNAVIANAIVDDGAGLKVDFSGAAFYCVDGDTTWRVIYSDGTTQTIKELDADGSLDGIAKTAASSTFQQFDIEIIPITSTKVDVIFKIDGVIVCKMKDKTYASATEMSAFFGSKNGSAAEEFLYVDKFRVYQKR